MTPIWETLEIEDILQAALIRDLGQSHGEGRYSCYVNARKYLLENILEQVNIINPNMTDHGPKHVKDVLLNINDLLGDSIGAWDKTSKTIAGGSLNCMELYLLALSALFHDVGNVFSREEHQKQIEQIFDLARPSSGGNQDAEEKRIILDICKAHCGDGVDGSKNTLQFVTERSKLERREIRPKLIASILRFADELAEGEQRTSHFMLKHLKYEPASIPFHRYAACSSVDIDRSHGRICLRYHISLSFREKSDEGANNSNLIPIDEVEAFLNSIYCRIEKLNQERQYSKHYCCLLDKFKETEASFNFWYKNHELPIDLFPVVFSDLVVPGYPQKSIVERYDQYAPTALIKKLSEAMKRMDE